MTRHAAIGTRVVLIDNRSHLGPGVIVAVRREPYLRPFVVALDNGEQVFASAFQVAREADQKRTPLGPSLHDD